MSATSMVQAKDRWWALATVCVAASLIMVDGSVVNLALPTLIGDLGLGPAAAEWVNVAYHLSLAALLLPGGAASDRFGHRAVLLAGLVTFLVASLLTGLAGDASTLLTGRALQGAGAAMILPATLATVDAAFLGPARAAAFGAWGGIIGGAVAAGPILGGALTSYAGWRWVFLVNAPVAVVVLLATARFLRPGRSSAASPLDTFGMATVAVGSAALAFALIEGARYGWWAPLQPYTIGPVRWPFDAVSPVPVAGAVAAGCAVVLVARRIRGPADTGRVRLPGRARTAAATIAVVQAGEVGLLFALPYALQSALGYSPMEAGLLLAAIAVGALSAAPLAGALSRRYDTRTLVGVGLVVEASAVGSLYMALAPGRTWAIGGLLFVYGAGLGFASAQLTELFLSSAPAGQVGRAAGVQSFVSMMGAAMGVAVLGAVLLTGLRAELDAKLAGVPNLGANERVQVRDEVADTLGGALPRLRADPDTSRAADEGAAALVNATRYVTLTASTVMSLAFLLSLRLPRGPERRAQVPHRT